MKCTKTRVSFLELIGLLSISLKCVALVFLLLVLKCVCFFVLDFGLFWVDFVCLLLKLVNFEGVFAA